MSSLGNIIGSAVEGHTSGGVTDRHSALMEVVEKVKADPDLAEICIQSDCSKRIKAAALRQSKKASETDTRQTSFFGLRSSYALDTEERNVKETDLLTRVEFEGLINLRQRQLNADHAQLMKLREALRQTADIWNRNPKWVWAQVEAAWGKLQREAA